MVCNYLTGEGIYPHRDFDCRIIKFVDFIFDRSMPYDDNGHGTHVAGILSGNGKMSNGKYRGIAPDCRIVCGK
ncbi:MAG: S8 family serine peptidase, partial [Lachnospiraceae bacterium]|nr:S8 family serine peptidase [Lachnospiraceae bacterium]